MHVRDPDGHPAFILAMFQRNLATRRGRHRSCARDKCECYRESVLTSAAVLLSARLSVQGTSEGTDHKQVGNKVRNTATFNRGSRMLSEALNAAASHFVLILVDVSVRVRRFSQVTLV